MRTAAITSQATHRPMNSLKRSMSRDRLSRGDTGPPKVSGRLERRPGAFEAPPILGSALGGPMRVCASAQTRDGSVAGGRAPELAGAGAGAAEGEDRLRQSLEQLGEAGDLVGGLHARRDRQE